MISNFFLLQIWFKVLLTVQAMNGIFIRGLFVKGWPRLDLHIEKIEMKLDFAKFATHVLKQFGTGDWSQEEYGACKYKAKHK